MEMQQYRYFLQLCEDRSFSIAADNLFISQQALRKSIKKVEEEIGMTLIYRKGNQICLTPVGECVRSFSSIIVADVERMKATIDAYRDDPGYTRITIVMANGCYDKIAPKVIEVYRAENPNVDVHIIERPDLTCESYVMRGMADFGFCFGPNDSHIFEVQPLSGDSVFAVVNKDNPLADRKSLKLTDFEGVPLGIADEWYKIHYNFIQGCRKAGFEPIIDFRGGDPFSTVMYSHITKNVSITVGEYCGRLAHDDQVVIPVEGCEGMSTLNLIVRKGISLNRNSWKFIDYCKSVNL